MSSLCRLFGYSRQGYWKRSRSVCRDALDECAVVGEVRRLRERMPMAGVRKLQSCAGAGFWSAVAATGW